MKNFWFYFALFIATSASAQTYTIKGHIKNQGYNKYAFLYSYPDSSTKVCPIVNHEFNFEAEVKRSNKLSEGGVIYLGASQSVSYESVKALRAVPPFIDYTRPVGIENFTIEIDDEENIKNAVVIGGDLNKQRDDMQATIISKDYEGFFKRNPDASISVSFLMALNRMSKFSGMIRFKDLSNDDFLRIYNSLSERLKNSEDGKKLSLELSK